MKNKFAYLTIAVFSFFILVAAIPPSMFEVQAPIMVFRATNPVIAFNGGLAWSGPAVSVLQSINSTGGAHARLRPVIITTSATPTALTRSNCDSVAVSNRASTTTTWVLPPVANAGCRVTFITGNAGTEVLINAATAVTCINTVTTKVGAANINTSILTDASCNTGLKNTTGTQAVGDNITLVSNGTQWLGTGITAGVWGSQ